MNTQNQSLWLKYIEQFKNYEPENNETTEELYKRALVLQSGCLASLIGPLKYLEIIRSVETSLSESFNGVNND